MEKNTAMRTLSAISTTSTVTADRGNKKTPNIEEMELSISERKMKLEAEQLQLENLKKANDEAKKKEALEEIDILLENADQYEKWAKEEISKSNSDKDLAESYLTMAREAKANAKDLRQRIGLDTEDETGTATKAEPLIFKKHVVGFVISIVVSLLTIWGSYHFMMEYKKDIDKQNASIVDPSLKIGNPYDDSSIQGIIYDNLVQFTDIPKLWLFLLIICSPIFFYALPIIKTKNSTWVDWQSVSPETRLWLLYAFSATIFLASAIYHVAGSGR